MFRLEGFRELQSALNATPEQITRAFTNIGASFSQIAEEVVVDTLVQAAAQAGPEAFPTQYIPPMVEAARRIIITLPTEVFIDFDQLGTADELAEAYHYKAKMAEGGLVDLPYGGEDLRNDEEGRYFGWLRVFHGETWHGIDYSGAWDETIAARLSVWGNKAPQWLLLEYGQVDWEPSIEPFPIVENITSELSVIFYDMLQESVEEIINALNQPVPKSVAPRDARGRFTKRG
jgi:hypothetical protein